MSALMGRMRRQGRPMNRRESAVVAALSAWAVTGLALDGRAHQDNAVESFFTPWHGILYSAIAASAVWTWWLVARRPSGPPTGFAVTVAGVGLLAAGGPADLLWHELFGLEADVEALLSPTHLMLMTGGIMLLSAPLRAAWHARAGSAVGERPPLAAVVSLALVAGVIAFFFQYASPFHETAAYAGNGHAEQELGLVAIALTNLILVAPLALLLRIGRLPVGAATIVFTVAAGVVAVSSDFEAWAAFAGAVAGGVAVDALGVVLRPGPDRPRQAFAFAVAAPLVLWSAVLAAMGLDGGMAWPVELWSGSILLAAGAGALLAVLARPDPSRPAAANG